MTKPFEPSLTTNNLKFLELLGVSDHSVYQYNAELRKIVRNLNLSHVQFVTVQDLLFDTLDTQESSEADYVARAARAREALQAVDVGQFDPDVQIKANESVAKSYQGYLRVLKLDLEGQEEPQSELSPRKSREKDIETTAKQMLEVDSVNPETFHSSNDSN